MGEHSLSGKPGVWIHVTPAAPKPSCPTAMHTIIPQSLFDHTSLGPAHTKSRERFLPDSFPVPSPSASPCSLNTPTAFPPAPPGRDQLLPQHHRASTFHYLQVRMSRRGKLPKVPRARPTGAHRHQPAVSRERTGNML